MKQYISNRYFFLFNHDENKIKNKKYSDKILDFFNIDKEKYYLSFKSNERIQINSIYFDESTFSYIIILINADAVDFFAREVFFNSNNKSIKSMLNKKERLFNNLGEELFHGKLDVEFMEKELVFFSDHLNDFNQSDVLMDKINKYNITGKEREDCLEQHEILINYHKERKAYYETAVSYYLNDSIESIFEEKANETSY